MTRRQPTLILRNGRRLEVTPSSARFASILGNQPNAWPPDQCPTEWAQSQDFDANAGMLPAVLHLLGALDYGDRERSPLQRGFPTLDAQNSSDPIPRFATRVVEGLIRCNSDPTVRCDLISEIRRAFPAADVAVLAATYDEVNQIAAILRQNGEQVDVITPMQCPDVPGRLVVSTFVAADCLAVGIPERDVIFVWDAIEGLGAPSRMTLSRAERARVFGFLRRNAPTAPREWYWLRRIFGFDEITIRRGVPARRVELYWERIRRGPRPDEVQNAFEAKRFLWRNAARNRQIARTAGEFRERQITRNENGRGIVVLTESVLHISELAVRLPRWKIWAGETDLAGLPNPLVNAFRAARSGDPNAVIATPDGLNYMFDRERIDTIIWAGAGRHPAPIDGVVFTLSDRAITLVDFEDAGCAASESTTAARRHAYDAVGWTIPSEDPAFARARHYLRKRRIR